MENGPASIFGTTRSVNSTGVEIKTELTEAELSKVSGGVQHKHLAGVKYEDITINCQR
jgi:bacteriocin-like protein